VETTRVARRANMSARCLKFLPLDDISATGFYNPDSARRELSSALLDTLAPTTLCFSLFVPPRTFFAKSGSPGTKREKTSSSLDDTRIFEKESSYS